MKTSKRVTLVGNVNSSEVNWETLESGDENTWENKSLRLTINNVMIQYKIEKAGQITYI